MKSSLIPLHNLSPHDNVLVQVSFPSYKIFTIHLPFYTYRVALMYLVPKASSAIFFP